jgi:addiction module RelE/StbE family toxin
MEVSLTPQFSRQFKKLSRVLQEEAVEKIELFENIRNHNALRVHTLHGKFKGHLSFSVNYKYRIVFVWEMKNKSAILVAIGSHSVYN